MFSLSMRQAVYQVPDVGSQYVDHLFRDQTLRSQLIDGDLICLGNQGDLRRLKINAATENFLRAADVASEQVRKLGGPFIPSHTFAPEQVSNVQGDIVHAPMFPHAKKICKYSA